MVVNTSMIMQIPAACPLPLLIDRLAQLTIRCTPPISPQAPSTPPDSPPGKVPTNVISCNGVNLVPCTVSLTNGTPIPLNPGFSTPNLVPVNNVQCVNSIPTTVNPAVYTCTPLTSTGVVQCTPRVINGQSVLQCTPGVCPVTPTILPTPTVTPAIYPLCSTVSSWKQSYGMEQVWQCEFKSLFSQYCPHNWMLFPVIAKPEGIWNANVDSAKVRFCCEDCGHGWTSMKGRVAFWFVLNQATGEGVVCLKLYGQQCDRCKSGNYEPAMWYPEEVLKVLVNIYNRVGQVYYGFQQAPYHRARRAGKPRTPHNSDLCQACKDGVCSERR